MLDDVVVGDDHAVRADGNPEPRLRCLKLFGICGVKRRKNSSNGSFSPNGFGPEPPPAPRTSAAAGARRPEATHPLVLHGLRGRDVDDRGLGARRDVRERRKPPPAARRRCAQRSLLRAAPGLRPASAPHSSDPRETSLRHGLPGRRPRARQSPRSVSTIRVFRFIFSRTSVARNGQRAIPLPLRPLRRLSSQGYSSAPPLWSSLRHAKRVTIRRIRKPSTEEIADGRARSGQAHQGCPARHADELGSLGQGRRARLDQLSHGPEVARGSRGTLRQDLRDRRTGRTQRRRSDLSGSRPAREDHEHGQGVLLQRRRPAVSRRPRVRRRRDLHVRAGHHAVRRARPRLVRRQALQRLRRQDDDRRPEEVLDQADRRPRRGRSRGAARRRPLQGRGASRRRTSRSRSTTSRRPRKSRR